MGDAADDMIDEAMRQHDEGRWCKKHRYAYLSDEVCIPCEDGEPPWWENKRPITDTSEEEG